MAGQSRRFGALLLWAVPVLAALLCLGFGRYALSTGDTLRVLLSPLTGAEIAPMERSVVFGVRLPRVLTALCCGAALALSGAAFQSLFNNPLATPDTLGVSSGASCGAVAALMFRLDMVSVQLFALCFGLGAVALTWNISKVRGKNSIIMIVLSGLVIGALFEAAVSLLKYVADPEEVLPTITYWLMGSLTATKARDVQFAAWPILVGLIPLWLLRWRVNLLTVSEAEARSMGVHTGRLRVVVVLCATLMTAGSVAISGMIGWVGLVIPHFGRMIFGQDYRKLLPASSLLGAVFLMVVDDLARTVTTSEIPLGILTSFVGAPVFLYLILSGGTQREH